MAPMVRVNREMNPQSVSAWIWVIIGWVVVLPLCILMARVKGAAKKSGRDDVAAGKRPVEGESSGGPPKKKQKSEQEKWEDTFAGRSVICERQVDYGSIRKKNTEPLARITARGLVSFYKPIDGYIRPLVVIFYQKIRIQEEIETIEAVVRGKTVRVTPDSIAEFLDYTRPTGSVTYPSDYEIGEGRIVQAVYENPSDFVGKFVPGDFKETYRLLNKVLHYNIFPRGLEKKPGVKEMELLYAFVHDHVMDIAQWIWYEIVHFRKYAAPTKAIPYPHMITELFLAAGVKRQAIDLVTPGETGPITAASLGKSSYMSKSVVTGPSSSSFTPKGRTAAVRSEEWLKVIYQELLELKSEQKKQRRRIDFCVNLAEEHFGTKYTFDHSDDETPVFNPDGEEESSEYGESEDEEPQGGAYESERDDE